VAKCINDCQSLGETTSSDGQNIVLKYRIESDGHPMSPHTALIAHCHLLLRRSRWIPVSVNRKLGANDRCAPDGAVISAFLSAVIEGDKIVGWLENSAFSVREVQTDGSLAALDLRAAALAMQADEADTKANRFGAIGITSRIAERRIKAQNTGGVAMELRNAAFERATIQILDKLQDPSVVGVQLVKSLR
jgi:hypothetical protein